MTRANMWVLPTAALVSCLVAACSNGNAGTGNVTAPPPVATPPGGTPQTGVLTSLSPSRAPAGSPDLDVLITMKDVTGSHVTRQAIWSAGGVDTNLNATRSTATEMSVVVPSGLLKLQGSTQIYVKYGDVRADSPLHRSNRLAFDILPAQTGAAKIDLPVVTGFASLDVPGAFLTRPNDINNAGVIVGRFDDASGIHGFVLDHGSVATVDFPGAGSTTLIGVNDAGQAVGRYVRGGVEHCFLLSDGTFVSLDFPGAVATQCHGIDSDGRIVGRYLDWQNPGQGGGGGRTHEHGFLMIGGGYQGIDYSGAVATDAWRIGENGDVIGDWSTNATANGSTHIGAVHGYILRSGIFDAVDVPGMELTSTREANANGTLAGICIDQAHDEHGFVRVGGTYTIFDFPLASATDANAINDAGAVVGSFIDASGMEHGFSAHVAAP